MKVTSIDLCPTNSVNEDDALSFSFRDPRNLNPFQVKNIVGLDPDVILSTLVGANGDTKFYTMMPEKREFVILLGLNPNFAGAVSYSDLRDALYKLISRCPTGDLILNFKNDTVIVATSKVFVSRLEAPLFNKIQEAQITVDSNEPFLLGPEEIKVTDIIDHTDSPRLITDDLSTAPHGFKFKMQITGNISALEISARTDDVPYWFFRVEPKIQFGPGDVIHFSSLRKDRYLSVDRNGTPEDPGSGSLISYIDEGSFWPLIFPGKNYFKFNHPEQEIFKEISYYPAYWGV